MEAIRNAPFTVWHWLRANPGSLPSLVALAAVAAFWIFWLLGGLSALHNTETPMGTLVSFYLVLALVAFSIIVAILAASDLGRRIVPPKRGYRRPRSNRTVY